MGKIFGISSLPVSTIGEALKPTQELVAKAPTRRIFGNKDYKFLKAPIKDVFVRRLKNPSTIK